MVGMLNMWEDDFTAAAHKVSEETDFLCDVEEKFVDHVNKSIPVWTEIIEELAAALKDDKFP